MSKDKQFDLKSITKVEQSPINRTEEKVQMKWSSNIHHLVIKEANIWGTIFTGDVEKRKN